MSSQNKTLPTVTPEIVKEFVKSEILLMEHRKKLALEILDLRPSIRAEDAVRLIDGGLEASNKGWLGCC
jgi:hypothetical protein